MTVARNPVVGRSQSDECPLKSAMITLEPLPGLGIPLVSTALYI